MNKHKSNKILLWLTTSALAVGFAVAALPSNLEDNLTASAATAEVVGTTFSDDFSKYDSYGQAGKIGGVRTTSGVGWTNQWFDGVGDGNYDSNCTSEYASITTDPADSTNQVLYLNTNKNNNSFFYLTPTKDGSPLVLKNYEISFKFKISPTTQSENRREAAPWFGTLNRKTITGDDSFVPGDGRYNGTNSLMTALRAGVRPGENLSEPNYFFSFSQKFMYSSTSDVPMSGEKKADGSRGQLDNNVRPSTIYNEWHAYKLVMNEDSFDLYLDGKHMGGAELGTAAGFNCVKVPGYISIALCVADIYLDDVNIKEILPEPAVDGASRFSVRADKAEGSNAIFSFVNTQTISKIKKGTEDLAAAHYTYSGNKLTIKGSYLKTLPLGEHTFTITANDGSKDYQVEIVIEITKVPGVVGGNTVTAAVATAPTATLENVSTIKSIKKDGTAISVNSYSFSNNVLTFTASYASTIGKGTHTFVIDTDNGEFTLTLVIKDKPAIEGSATITVNQGDSAAVTLKNVDSIVSITYDGTAIDRSNYSYASGVLTFNGAYTATLATGKQSHVINTDAGALNVALYVKANAAVTNVNNLIKKIASSVSTRAEYETELADYTAAKNAYDALSASAQAGANKAALDAGKAMLDAFKAKMDAADAVDAQIAALPTSVTQETYDSVKAAYDTVRAAYNNLDVVTQSLVTKFATLTELANKLSAIGGEDVAANEVIALINNIQTGAITDSNYSLVKSQIVAAETAYSYLSENGKALVSNYATLTSRRADLNAFEAKFVLEANEVIALIDVIPTSCTNLVEYVAMKEAYTVAKNAYDALNNEAKALVSNVAKLTSAGNVLDSFDVPTASADDYVAIKSGENAVIATENVVGIIEIKLGNNVLPQNVYTFANNTLTIKAGYIGTLSDVENTFAIYVSTADEPLIVTVARTSASVVNGAQAFEKATGGDITFEIEDATSVTLIKRKDGSSFYKVAEENYVDAIATDGTVTLKASYLANRQAGANVFVIVTDNGNVEVSIDITATVTVKLTTSGNVTISGANTQEIAQGTQQDVSFTLSGVANNAEIKIKRTVGETTQVLNASAYTYAGGVLTLKADFVKSLKAGTMELSVEVIVKTSGTTGGNNTNTSTTQPEESKKGCKGSLGFAGSMMAAAVVGTLAMARKKKRK